VAAGTAKLSFENATTGSPAVLSEAAVEVRAP
jgi:hypothetical protein